MRISFVYPAFLWLLLLVPLTIGVSFLQARTERKARFWTGLALRTIILIALILALAGIHLQVPNESLAVVYLLDMSDSITPEEQERAEALIQASIQSMPEGDQAAIVVFGKNALVERLSSGERRLAEITSAPVTTRTDIASALRLGMALFPNESAKRVVLLSDGRENLSQALEQAELAGLQGIELRYVPLGAEYGGEGEVRIEEIHSPANLFLGEVFNVEVTLDSSVRTGALLTFFADDQLIESREVQLEPGSNSYQTLVEADEPGFMRLRVQVVPDVDSYLQNNEVNAFAIVHGPPQVLLVTEDEEEAASLEAALTASDVVVTVVLPGGIPTTLSGLAGYDAVVLLNVPATALPSTAMELLPAYVRDLGKGLLMTGGESSFGAGGYLRTPIEETLPVDMDVQSKERIANLAMVLAVDKSGSMGRCHCDNPDLNQSYTRQEVGQPKVDIAKEAIMRSASALGDLDYLGVVVFDSGAAWALSLAPLVDPHTLEQSIGVVQANGQTNMAAGVIAAYEALEGVDARYKHIILLTDGWERSGDLSELVLQKYEEGITLSIVGAGGGSALYLQDLAALGGGQYYPATDMMNVPDIFLKETVRSAGEYIIEEPFYPIPAVYTPAMMGIDEALLPVLLGYNGTTAKQTARINLLTPRGDPLLASWQYGLGRSAVWTSDLKGKWGSEWVSWEGFTRFSSQLIGWLLPPPQPEGMDATATLEDDEIHLQLEAQDEQGRAMNLLEVSANLIDPDLEATEVRLTQTGFGKYEADAPVTEAGTYLVQMSASQDELPVGQATLGVVVPYSPEYKQMGVDRYLLLEIAQLTGGGELTDPMLTFEHSLPEAVEAREIWAPFLLLALLLFIVDVANRRLVIRREDLRRLRVWMIGLLPSRRGEAAAQPLLLGRLFEARGRARHRREEHGQAAPEVKPPRGDLPEASEKPETAARPASQEESLARLREAKKRARGED